MLFLQFFFSQSRLVEMEQLIRFYSAGFHLTLIHKRGTSMYSLNTAIDGTN